MPEGRKEREFCSRYKDERKGLCEKRDGRMLRWLRLLKESGDNDEI